MLLPFTCVLALSAAVPPAPEVVGPVPRLVSLKPDSTGKVTVPVFRTEKQRLNAIVVGADGTRQEGEFLIERNVPVELTEIKDLKVYTAAGKEVPLPDAIKTLGTGATVVVSADGRSVHPTHLKIFRDETLVLVSPEFVSRGTMPGIIPGLVPPTEKTPQR